MNVDGLRYFPQKSIGIITLIRITLHCPLCGKEWGTKFHSLEELNADLEKGDKFICFSCRFGDRIVDSGRKGDYYGEGNY